MNKQEIIKQLREIASLRSDILIRKGENNIGNCTEPIEETAKAVKQVFADYNLTRPTIPQIFEDYDLFKNGPQTETASNSKPKLIASGIVGFAVMIITGMAGLKSTPAIIIGIVAAIATLILISKLSKNKSAQTPKAPTWQEKYANYDFDTEIEKFFSECKTFDEQFLVIIKPWADIIIARREKKVSNDKTIEEAKEKLSKYTIIDREYFAIADRIAGVLQDDRAEELGEAINIVLEEIRAEEQLKATKEQNKKLEKIEELFDL